MHPNLSRVESGLEQNGKGTVELRERLLNEVLEGRVVSQSLQHSSAAHQASRHTDHFLVVYIADQHGNAFSVGLGDELVALRCMSRNETDSTGHTLPCSSCLISLLLVMMPLCTTTKLLWESEMWGWALT
jgi:hypothetical protein